MCCKYFLLVCNLPFYFLNSLLFNRSSEVKLAIFSFIVNTGEPVHKIRALWGSLVATGCQPGPPSLSPGWPYPLIKLLDKLPVEETFCILLLYYIGFFVTCLRNLWIFHFSLQPIQRALHCACMWHWPPYCMFHCPDQHWLSGPGVWVQMVSFDVLAGRPVAVGLGSDSYSDLKAPNGLMGIKGSQHTAVMCVVTID